MSRRSRWRTVGVPVLLVLLLTTVPAVAAGFGTPEPGIGIAGEAAVTASSTAPGRSPHDLVTSGEAGPGAGWEATEGTGAWVELTWSGPRDLHQVALVQPAGRTAVAEGFLSFGDGSQLLVRTSASSPVTVVPFATRTVERLRFTVSRLAPGAATAALGELMVDAALPAGEVRHGDRAGGDVTDAATVTASSTSSSPSAVPPASGAAGADLAENGWVQLAWPGPRELASVRLTGDPAAPGPGPAAGTLSFSDGSTLPVGAVTADPDTPTTVAFLPRVVTSVRFTATRVEGAGSARLGGFRAFETGGTPPRPVPAPVASAAPTARAATGCPARVVTTFTVLCPQNGAVVEGPVPLRVAGAGDAAAVTATLWPADPAAPTPPEVRATPDRAGTVVLDLDTTAAGPGPLTVRVATEGDGVGREVFLQLQRPAAGPADPVPSGPPATGRTLVLADEFDGPLSASRSGAGTEYAAAKPVYDGEEDFGDAVFADPATGPSTVTTVDGGYLRIGVEPLPSGSRDPQGWGRTSAGGMLASARSGGSGFAAQYGYFEARMLAPAAPGTWPAFWNLPADNLVAPTPLVAEIDTVELYGHEPRGACHSVHEHGGSGGGGRCRDDLYPSTRAALGWHTYGVSVTPTEIEYFVDGRSVVRQAQVGGGDVPMFFLLDLALGGGWPIDLRGTGGRTDLYVDYVRVYV